MLEVGCEPIFLQTERMHSCSLNHLTKQRINSKPQSSQHKGVEKQLDLHMQHPAATELLSHPTPCGYGFRDMPRARRCNYIPCGQPLGSYITSFVFK